MLREIVNGAQLAGHMNEKVSIIGFVTERDPRNGLWFDLRSTDNQIVRITLKKPMDAPLEGYVEVHGISTGKGVQADDLVTYANEKFDAKAHNTLCNLLNSIPNLWNTS